MRPAVQFHEDLAASWEEKYRQQTFQSREKLLKELLQLHDLASRIWLDAGCGTGTLARVLADLGAQVRAVDASPAMISRAKELSTNHASILYEAVDDLESVGFPPDSFDGVLCSSVLEYLDCPDRALAFFFHVLRPGGLLICSVPNRRSLLRKLQSISAKVLQPLGRYRPFRYLDHSRHAFALNEFKQLLTSHGFSVEKAVLFGAGRSFKLSSGECWAPLIMVVATKAQVA